MCNTCTHLFNQAFDPQISAYDSTYENSLHFSAHFREHAKSLAKHLVSTYDLENERIAEAGAGPGHFLELLCQEGAAEAYGFDPSYDPDRLGAPKHASVKLSSELFPDDKSLQVKMAMSQHVLEHLEEPVALLSILNRSTESISGAIVYSEVPNADLMLEQCALWDLIYEHFSYFTKQSLTAAIRNADLNPVDVGTMYGDQFLYAVSNAESDSKPIFDGTNDSAVEAAIKFGETARATINRAKENLQSMSRTGNVALWGAGSKGMTYLNIVADEGQISAVVDVNPRKLGYGVPGTAFTISEPATLKSNPPSTVLIANPIYKKEISDALTTMGISAAVVPLW